MPILCKISFSAGFVARIGLTCAIVIFSVLALATLSVIIAIPMVKLCVWVVEKWAAFLGVAL